MFHPSHSSQHTDSTVYPDPTQSDRKESKKRKVQDSENGVGSASVTENARYAESVLSNKHLTMVHDFLKAEFEELGVLCVSAFGSCLVAAG